MHKSTNTLAFMSQPNSFDKQIRQTNKFIMCVFTCVTEYCNVCNINAMESFVILHQCICVCTVRDAHNGTPCLPSIPSLAVHTKALTIAEEKTFEIHRSNAKWKTSVVILTTQSPPNTFMWKCLPTQATLKRRRIRKDKLSYQQSWLYTIWLMAHANEPSIAHLAQQYVSNQISFMRLISSPLIHAQNTMTAHSFGFVDRCV